ncbi:Proline--tRNA ligase [Frankliniella fusca]|uniref:Proline--tRNA ligase n=1 Tax=Frankliniella fusca TaxID=407009 RepID=A0AAE1LT30_9NEOP|nr:Proline--tRNA ligase [Frankliniella fusca]
MLPINRKVFYKGRDSDGDSSQTECRWTAKCTADSSVNVPPTDLGDDLSSALSPPTSGFSSPWNASVTTSPGIFPPIVSKVNTRFTRSLFKKNLIHLFDEQASPLRESELVSLPSLKPANKCTTWIKSVASASAQNRCQANKENQDVLSPRSKRLSELCHRSRNKKKDAAVTPNPKLHHITSHIRSPELLGDNYKDVGDEQSSRLTHTYSSQKDAVVTPSHKTDHISCSPDLFEDCSEVVGDEQSRLTHTHSSQKDAVTASIVTPSPKNDHISCSPDLFEDCSEVVRDEHSIPNPTNSSENGAAVIPNPLTDHVNCQINSPGLIEDDSKEEQSILTSHSTSPEEIIAGRPQRRCNQIARVIENRTSDDEGQQYGSYFGDHAFDSGDSDAYQPSRTSSASSRDSSSSNSDDSKELENRKTKKKPSRRTVDRLSEELDLSSPDSPDSPDVQPLTSSDSQPCLTPTATEKPARQKGTTEKIRKNRKLRNSGQEYTTLKGKVIAGREMKPLSACRMKCATKLNEEGRIEIFNEYWALNDFNLRVTYIANHVFQMEKKTSRKRVEGSSRNRSCTLKYELEQDNTRIQVCKKCFLDTLSENDGFVKRALLNKNKSYSGVTRSDQRGQKSSSKKCAQSVVDCINNHISSFPKYVSHYGRSQSNKQYLGADLSLNQMYRLYLENDNNPKVSRSTYLREFNKTGLKFKPPAVDTCNKCDSLKQALKHCTNEEEKALLEEQRRTHQQKSEAAYAAKKADKDLAKGDPSKQVLMFDLEQVLPCPLLSSGETFYKRQLSVYNLTVYNCSTKMGTNYMWSEVDAGRGANEIASCITRYLNEEVKEPVTHITMYSDTCSGQNKNSHMCAALIATVKNHPSLKVIDHKFLVPGHTYMECDQVHAQIEKKKKKTTLELHHPRDWYNFIRTVPYNNSHLLVREMKQEHFLNFASLLQMKNNGPLVMRAKDEDGEPFLFSSVQWFRYRRENSTTVLFKKDLQTETSFKNLNFRRRGKMGNDALKPEVCHRQMLPISVNKKNDLLSLLPQINPVYHSFYEKLPSSANHKDLDPDCIPQSVDVAEDLLEEIANQ